jgi:putative oxidoreductase
VSEFFASLGIPLPTLNVYFIGSLECFGSLLLIIGLAWRPLSLLIVVSITVAYLTADFEAVSKIFSDPDKFAKADPFRRSLSAFAINQPYAGYRTMPSSCIRLRNVLG